MRGDVAAGAGAAGAGAAGAGAAGAGAAGAGAAGAGPAGAAASLALGVAAVAPWLAMLPVGGAAGVLASVLALIAAMHGAGLALALAAGRPAVHPLLAIQWGLATLVGLLGIAIALGAGGLATQAALVYGFAGVHTALLARRFTAYRARLAGARASVRSWLAPAALLAGIAVLHVLGPAGDLGARPFDDDGHVLAQLQRLRDSGGLGDPIGYARSAQLGGQLAIEALATLGGDVYLVRLAEGLAFVLALGLVLARLRRAGEADATSGLWGLVLVLAGAAFTYTRADPATCWTAVGLVLALGATLEDHDAAPLPIGVTAGALIALRFELAPVAAAALVAAWWPHRRAHRRTAVLIAGVLAVVAPYAAARIAAWSSVPAAALALVEPVRGPLGARLAIAAGVGVACAPLIAAAWRERGLRWLAIGAALALAGIAGGLTGDRPYAASFLWPLAIAGALVLAIRIARHRKITSAALLVSLVAAVLIYEGRTATGRRRWTRRYLDLAAHVEYLRHAGDPAPVGGGYAALLHGVPAGAVVAAWVARPERLDYGAGYRIVDLRTPRTAWLREVRPWPHPSSLEALLARVGADYLLVEADDRRRQRAAAWPARIDDLEALALRGPAIAEAGGVRLIDLRAGLRRAP